MVKSIDTRELEDTIINAITPAYTIFSMLVSGEEIDISHIKNAKSRLADIRVYLKGLVND